MSPDRWIQISFFLLLLLALTPLLGSYIANVFMDEWTILHPLLQPIEKFSYKVAHINPKEEMSWRTYCKVLIYFNLYGFALLFLLQLCQGMLFLNPEKLPGVSWSLAFNTAASFVTNTNWQAYAGETTLSYLTQMLGLTSQNFLSPASGMAALLALTRGISRRSVETIGNFWVDVVKTVVYLLLPLAFLLAIALVSQGVIQSFSPAVNVTTLENEVQTIPLGPTASQVAIKQLGTNGGGFFNTNSAHPYENPSHLTNFLQMLSLVLIPASLVYAYGVMISSKHDGWVLFFVMLALWSAGTLLAIYSENIANPVLLEFPILEGKETRFGITNSIIWSTLTTSTSNGSVNSMLSSLSPLAQAVVLLNIMLEEVIFGGIGVGLCGMLIFTLFTVFLSGLMVGRTPEYLGKKIEKREIQWVCLVILVPAILTLLGSAISCLLPIATSETLHKGPHGLTEIIYAFASSAANNGSGFNGLHADTPYFNISLGIIMILSRVSILVPCVAIGGLLARKRASPQSSGTFSTNTFLFGLLLFSVIIIMGSLTFFSALALGPVVEHFLMLQGIAF